MFYLIDDKKERQTKLAPYLIEGKNLKLIYQWSGELADEREVIFSTAKVIALHSSFFKNPVNRHPTKGEDMIRRDLQNFCTQHKIKLIYFSGDYTAFNRTNYGCLVPVDRFYRHLNYFIKDGMEEVAILGFGKDYKIEGILLEYARAVRDYSKFGETYDQVNLFIPVWNLIKMPEKEQAYLIDRIKTGCNLSEIIIKTDITLQIFMYENT